MPVSRQDVKAEAEDQTRRQDAWCNDILHKMASHTDKMQIQHPAVMHRQPSTAQPNSHSPRFLTPPWQDPISH